MTYDHDGRIVELPADECRELLTTTTVGRIAFVDDGGQQLVPVNFVYRDGSIYFRTLPDRMLAGVAGRDVAFGVDHHEAMFRKGWNVTVKGPAEVVDDPETVETMLSDRRLRPWAGGVRPLVIRVAVDDIAGRKVMEH